MPKEMEHFTFQHPIKNPADLDLRGFQYGGRGRNRTGVGGFASRVLTPLQPRPAGYLVSHYSEISYAL